MRPSLDDYFLEIAQVVAKRSTCLRRAVGCVLVNERGHLLATGYNGVAAGMAHCNDPRPLLDQTFDNEKRMKSIAGMLQYPNACPGATAESGTMLDGCHAIHAEQNALLQCRDVHEITSCYVTASPCVTCIKLLMSTSCIRVVFAQLYPGHETAKELWEIPRKNFPRRRFILKGSETALPV